MSLAGFCVSYCTSLIHKDVTGFISYHRFTWYPEHPTLLVHSVKDPDFCLRPFLYFKVTYLFTWICLLCAQVPWPFIFPRNPPMSITLSEPSCTLKLSLRREGEAKRPRRCSPFKAGNTLCWGCFCSDPSILHSGLFHHLRQSSGSSTGDPDKNSLPSQSPWWWPCFKIYVIQVYQETYNSIHGLFFFFFPQSWLAIVDHG